jgi:class 3 adenylate cyclase
VRGEEEELLGWFFFGVDAESRVERTFQNGQRSSGREGRSGLVVDGEWFVRGVSAEEAESFKKGASEELWTGGEPEEITVDGKNFLLIAKELNPDSPMGKGFQVAVFPLEHLTAAVARMRMAVCALGGCTVLVALVGAFFLAGRFSKPIAELVEGTERVRRGDLQGEVRVSSRDELGVLARAFNAMTQDLALKERYREVLVKVSDPAVAQRLVEGDLALGGEVREAAVLFCDIRGFTAMTEGMDPREVIDLVNEHMTAMTKMIYLHGGVVDKFVGDLVMAIFGVPTSQGQDELRAARCALEMIDERRRLSEESGRVVEVGIGVAYGELVAGCMGSEDRLNYTVLGDRVNLASRLCSAAGRGEVIVDDAIAHAVSDEIVVEERERVSLKGFSEPVEVFALSFKGPA